MPVRCSLFPRLSVHTHARFGALVRIEKKDLLATGSAGEDHALAHAEAHNTEYWRMMDGISTPMAPGSEPPGLMRLRFFDVEDMGLFVETQEQIEAVAAAGADSRPRMFFVKQFRHADRRDVVMASPYEN